MPRLESDIAKVQASCAIVLYNGTNIKAPRKVYLVPKGINVNTKHFSMEVSVMEAEAEAEAEFDSMPQDSQSQSPFHSLAGHQ
jgi:hypothetical protein